MGRTRSGSKLRDDDAESGARDDGVASSPLRTSSPYEKVETAKNKDVIKDEDKGKKIINKVSSSYCGHISR